MDESSAIYILPSGDWVTISARDMWRVSQHKWFKTGNGYAAALFGPSGAKRRVYLHRFIMDPPPDLEVDHISRDRLDCRRENMRNVTHAQNMQNTPRVAPSTGYRGVGFVKSIQKYRARVTVAGKDYVRYFDHLADAVHAAQAMRDLYHTHHTDGLRATQHSAASLDNIAWERLTVA